MSKVEQPGIGATYITNGRLSNNPNNLVTIHHGAMATNTEFEMGVSLGRTFIATDTESMSDTQTKEYAIQTSDIYDDYHFKFEVGANNAVLVQFYRNPNISDAGYAAASDLATQNKNDNFSDLFSDCSVMADPTLVTSYGVPWEQHFAGAFRSPTAITSEKFELAPNSNYILQITSTSNNTIMSMNVEFQLESNISYTPS